MTLGALKEEQITILIDTREQAPFAFPGMSTEAATLRAGDYSAHGLENEVAVERKSLPDLVACIGRERERFKAELVRLAGTVRGVWWWKGRGLPWKPATTAPK